VGNDTRLLIQQGTAAYQAGKYAEAERLLRQVIERNANYANVYNMLGVIASQRGTAERAVELFRRALAVNPTYREARLNLAITLAEMGAYQEAVREAEEVGGPAASPAGRPEAGVLAALANAHADLAAKYHALRMYADAVQECDKALRLRPDFPDIHHRRALSCLELGDVAGAGAALARALELNPNYVEAHVRFGVLYRRTDRLEEAVAAWKRALALNPTHPLARIYLAQATASRADG
jgi:tetratricopeptide (TPR) repeat protein